jgi:hypothetical protein
MHFYEALENVQGNEGDTRRNNQSWDILRFSCGLFYDAVSISGYLASNGGMIGE